MRKIEIAPEASQWHYMRPAVSQSLGALARVGLEDSKMARMDQLKTPDGALLPVFILSNDLQSLEQILNNEKRFALYAEGDMLHLYRENPNASPFEAVYNPFTQEFAAHVIKTGGLFAATVPNDGVWDIDLGKSLFRSRDPLMLFVDTPKITIEGIAHPLYGLRVFADFNQPWGGVTFSSYSPGKIRLEHKQVGLRGLTQI